MLICIRECISSGPNDVRLVTRVNVIRAIDMYLCAVILNEWCVRNEKKPQPHDPAFKLMISSLVDKKKHGGLWHFQVSYLVAICVGEMHGTCWQFYIWPPAHVIAARTEMLGTWTSAWWTSKSWRQKLNIKKTQKQFFFSWVQNPGTHGYVAVD